MDSLITVADAAKSLGVNVETVRRWVRLGELKAYTKPGKGRTMFVEKSQVDKRKEPVLLKMSVGGVRPSSLKAVKR